MIELKEINGTGWFCFCTNDNQFTLGYKYKFTKIKKFHMFPKKIGKQIFWLNHSYYVERITEKFIVITVGDNGYPKVDTIQIRKKDYFSTTSEKDIWVIYEKLVSIIRVS